MFELMVYMIYGSAFLGLLLLTCLIGEKISETRRNQKEYELKRLALRKERLKAIRERNKQKHRKSV